MIHRYVSKTKGALRLLLQVLLFPCQVIWGLLQFAFSFLRSSHQLIESWPRDGIALGPRVALFIHFDRARMVQPHVIRYVRRLQECGFSVVFVTNSGQLREASLTSLQPLCSAILIRRNLGYDFGALRETLEFLALPRTDTERLLIANDSVYGPLRPLDDVLKQIDFDKGDFWGLTESWQSRYHLQGYFLIAGRKVLTSETWRKFWCRVRQVQSRYWVFEHYEVGLTRALVRARFSCKAIWRYTDLINRVDASPLADLEDDDLPETESSAGARRSHIRRIIRGIVLRRPLNPRSDFWRELVRSDYPFLKRKLLLRNPTRVLDIADWRDEVKRKFGADAVTVIDADLKIAMRDRAP